MKNASKLVLLTTFISLLSAFAANPISGLPESDMLTEINNTTPKVSVEEQIVNMFKEANSGFLSAIGRKESSNNYTAVNRWGYMGKYQFGRKTLDGLGYSHITNEEFLSTPFIQEEAMMKLLQSNKYILRREIRRYSGTAVNGVYITESGLLAAAHLAGPGNVRMFLKDNINVRDGFGTSLVNYLDYFSNYPIEI